MKNFARIENGKVVERLDAKELPPFHPSLHWEQCQISTQVGCLFDGSSFMTPVIDVMASKIITWERIKSERDRRIQTGGCKIGEKWFHSDTFSRAQQIGLVMLGERIPANTLWKTMDGSFVNMTKEMANQIVSEISINDQKVFDVAETHKSKMELSDDPSEYDFSTGWPKIYGE